MLGLCTRNHGPERVEDPVTELGVGQKTGTQKSDDKVVSKKNQRVWIKYIVQRQAWELGCRTHWGCVSEVGFEGEMGVCQAAKVSQGGEPGMSRMSFVHSKDSVGAGATWPRSSGDRGLSGARPHHKRSVVVPRAVFSSHGQI